VLNTARKRFEPGPRSILPLSFNVAKFLPFDAPTSFRWFVSPCAVVWSTTVTCCMLCRIITTGRSGGEAGGEVEKGRFRTGSQSAEGSFFVLKAPERPEGALLVPLIKQLKRSSLTHTNTAHTHTHIHTTHTHTHTHTPKTTHAWCVGRHRAGGRGGSPGRQKLCCELCRSEVNFIDATGGVVEKWPTD
jgi:hypothetical protein